MPCYEPPRPDLERAEIQRRLDVVTRVACTAMKIILGGISLEDVPAEEWTAALVWYAAHAKSDAARGGK